METIIEVWKIWGSKSNEAITYEEQSENENVPA